tara:strand:- start:1832 stop:2617 length:786 start_codon:yes stop_codon:yes gene_type:complete
MKFDNSKIKFSKNDLRKNIILPDEMTPLLAEEIGLHVGDGSMNFYKNKNNQKGFYQLRGHIIDDKDHYSSRIKYIYKRLYNLNISLRKMPSTGVLGFQVWSNALVSFKHEKLKLILGDKLHITIPNEFFENNELSKSFLRGYYDTDGCLYVHPKNGKMYPRIEITSISKELIEKVSIILKNLGFRFSIHREDREKYGWNDLYKLRISGPTMVHKWFYEISPKNPKHIKKYKKWARGDSNSGLREEAVSSLHSISYPGIDGN